MEVTGRSAILRCVCVVAGTLLLVREVPAAAADKSLQYFPQDQAMQMVTKEYASLYFGESQCAQVQRTFSELALCKRCVNDVKTRCPDCCISDKAGKRAIECSEDDSGEYACGKLPFSASACGAFGSCDPSSLYTCPDPADPDAIPGCQRLGCPPMSPAPAASGEKQCQQPDPAAHQWICDEDNLSPQPGCAPTAASGIQNCYTLAEPYVITPVPCPWNMGKTCYSYRPSVPFIDCVNACVKAADDYERCTRKRECCSSQVCDKKGFSRVCSANACGERIATPACESYSMEDCVRLETEVFNCVTDATSGKCHVCFIPIDDSFQYTFVAKSNERIIVMWQIISKPDENSANADASFYTMVKIRDDVGVVVHDSIVNQKSFAAAFSIFGATAVDPGVLRPGKSYTVKPYCFVPPLNKGLRIAVEKLQLIVMRLRE